MGYDKDSDTNKYKFIRIDKIDIKDNAKFSSIKNLKFNFDTYQKYFDKSKFNFNYLQKLNDEKDRYKLELVNLIDQYKLIKITELNKIFLDKFKEDENKSDFTNLKNSINKFKKITESFKNDVDKVKKNDI